MSPGWASGPVPACGEEGAVRLDGPFFSFCGAVSTQLVTLPGVAARLTRLPHRSQRRRSLPTAERRRRRGLRAGTDPPLRAMPCPGRDSGALCRTAQGRTECTTVTTTVKNGVTTTHTSISTRPLGSGKGNQEAAQDGDTGSGSGSGSGFSGGISRGGATASGGGAPSHLPLPHPPGLAGRPD